MKRNYSILLLTLISFLMLCLSKSNKLKGDLKENSDISRKVNFDIRNNNNNIIELSNRLFMKQNYEAISIKEQNLNDLDKKIISEEEKIALTKSINSNYNNMKVKNHITRK